MKIKQIIRIVDDDLVQIDALQFLLESSGFEVATFNCASDFLTSDSPSIPGCAILDLQMPGIDGLSLLQILKEREYPNPIIFLSAHGSLKKAVSAMKLGCVDFLEKPVNIDELIGLLTEIEKKNEVLYNVNLKIENAASLFTSLTNKEKTIASYLEKELTKPVIAERLGLSLKTVDNHLQSMYKKLQIHSIDELKRAIKLVKLTDV